MKIVYKPSQITPNVPAGGCSSCAKKRAVNGINSMMPDTVGYVLPSSMKLTQFKKNEIIEVIESDFNYLISLKRHGYQIFYPA